MIQIRPLHRDDRIAIENHIYRKVDISVGRDTYSARNKSEFRRTQRVLDGSCGLALVAVLDNGPIGYLLIDFRRRGATKHAEIIQLYVEPARRRQLVASRLMTHARSTMSNAKVQTISVLASPSNEVALAFYEKLGMRQATVELECSFESFGVSSSPDSVRLAA